MATEINDSALVVAEPAAGDKIMLTNAAGTSFLLMTWTWFKSWVLSLFTVVLEPDVVTYDAAEGALIEKIVIVAAGVNDVKIGTSDGGDEIVGAQVNEVMVFTVDYYCTADTTIYFTVPVGATIKIYKR